MCVGRARVKLRVRPVFLMLRAHADEDDVPREGKTIERSAQ